MCALRSRPAVGATPQRPPSAEPGKRMSPHNLQLLRSDQAFWARHGGAPSGEALSLQTGQRADLWGLVGRAFWGAVEPGVGQLCQPDVDPVCKRDQGLSRGGPGWTPRL